MTLGACPWHDQYVLGVNTYIQTGINADSYFKPLVLLGGLQGLTGWILPSKAASAARTAD